MKIWIAVDEEALKVRIMELYSTTCASFDRRVFCGSQTPLRTPWEE